MSFASWPQTINQDLRTRQRLSSVSTDALFQELESLETRTRRSRLSLPTMLALAVAGLGVLLCGCDGSNNDVAVTRRFGFAGPDVLQAGPETSDLAAGDLNNDGKFDLVSVDRQTNTLTIRMNETPPFTFVPSFGTQFNLNTGNGPEAIAIGDLNGDRLADIAIIDKEDDQLSLYINQTMPGSLIPTFSSPQTFALPDGPQDITLADVNTDGILDILTVSQNASQFSVYINATSIGDTTLILQARNDFAAGLGTVAIAVGDINRDGRQDVATVGANTDFVSVFLNTTAQNSSVAGFPFREDFNVGNGPQGVLIDDFNLDGIPDVAVSVNARARMDILINHTPHNNNKTFLPFADTYTLGVGPTNLVRGDFDNNGLTDFAVLQPTGGFATVYLNDFFKVTSGPQDYTDFIIGQDLNTGADARGFIVADFNNDGQDDLMFANAGNNDIFLYLNN